MIVFAHTVARRGAGRQNFAVACVDDGQLAGGTFGQHRHVHEVFTDGL